MQPFRSLGLGVRFKSTKHYVHATGLSCCFRQWRADHSHCRFLHGYALSVKLTFSTLELDGRNWVVDFGGLKEIKDWLSSNFDHRTLVARDDPEIHKFRDLHNAGLIQLNLVDHVGCEFFSYYIYHRVCLWLQGNQLGSRVLLDSVEVSEHDGNSAICESLSPSFPDQPVVNKTEDGF